jgi:hypothetical protein
MSTSGWSVIGGIAGFSSEGPCSAGVSFPDTSPEAGTVSAGGDGDLVVSAAAAFCSNLSFNDAILFSICSGG